MKRTIAVGSILLASSMLTLPALAQDDNVQVLSNWNYDSIYQSNRSVEWMIDNTSLIGATGDKIGGIENVIFSDDGQALALIAEVGGFWDIGDSYVSVPWEQVEIDVAAGTVAVPVTEDNVGDYFFSTDGLFGPEGDARLAEAEARSIQGVDDDLTTGPDIFKATDLIGDYSFAESSSLYGYVNDILPVAEYGHDLGCSVVGLGVYRGGGIDGLDGVYLVGDNCSGTIWGLGQDADGNWVFPELAQAGVQITAGATNPDGDVFVTSCNCNYGCPQATENQPGALWRVVSDAGDDQ